MTKNSQVISFRFTTDELEALKAQQQPEESFSQTAQRLLRQSLGLSRPSTVIMSTPLLSTESTNVDNLIELRLAPVYQRLKQVEETLEKLPA